MLKMSFQKYKQAFHRLA